MRKQSEGHRERLRRRYLEGGIRGFSESDALELLLTFALPRRDTKQLARTLLDRFGSLRGVFSQPPAMFRAVKGIGPAASVLLNLVPATTAMSLRPAEGRLVVDGPSSVREYLAARMGTTPHLLKLDCRKAHRQIPIHHMDWKYIAAK